MSTSMQEEIQKELESQRTLIFVLQIFHQVTTVLGNGMTMYILIKNSALRTKRANMFIISLAVSDLCMGIMVAPLSALVTLESSWILGHHACQYHGFLIIMLGISSTLTLALTSINRFFNVVRYSVYPRYFTFRRTVIMIACAWLLGILFPCIYILSGEQFVSVPAKLVCYMDIKAAWFSIIGLIIFILFPFVIMVYCYTRVYLVTRKHNSQIFSSANNGRLNVQEVKITRMLFVIVMFYVVSWTPVFLIDSIDTFRGYSSLPFYAYVVYTLCAASSNCVNPFIYGIMNPTFRREYLKVFKCSKRHINSISVRPVQSSVNHAYINQGRCTTGRFG